MKKIIIAVLTLSIFFSANAQKGLTLSGKVDNYSGEKVYLSKVGLQKIIMIDTTASVNGNFTFPKKITSSDIYMINFEGIGTGVLIFPEKEDIIAKVKLSNNNIESYDVKAGSLQTFFQNDYKELRANKLKMNKYFFAYQQAQADKNDTAISRLEKQFEITSNVIKKIENRLIEDNGTNILGLYFIASNISEFNYGTLKAKLDKVSESAKKGLVFAGLSDYFAQKEKLKIGSMAPDFTLPTPEGTMLSLSQFRGKVVVIDCWASWCGPCRAESPNMVALYNAYKDKNFTILGVSLDKDKSQWIKAISDDKLTWNHVSDLKYWQSTICSLYAISTVPETFIIDRDGKIAARGLRGEDLNAKVAELLK